MQSAASAWYFESSPKKIGAAPMPKTNGGAPVTITNQEAYKKWLSHPH